MKDQIWLFFLLTGLGLTISATGVWLWITSRPRTPKHGPGGQSRPGVQGESGSPQEIAWTAPDVVAEDKTEFFPPPIVDGGGLTEHIDVASVLAIHARLSAVTSARKDAPLPERTVEMPPPTGVIDGVTEEFPFVHVPPKGRVTHAPPAPDVAPVSPTPVVVGLTTLEIGRSFDIAVQAFERWEMERSSSHITLEGLATGAERTLQRALSEASLASESASREVFEVALRDPTSESARRAVAALILLRRAARHTLTMIDGLVDNHGIAADLRRVLLLWRGPDTDWQLIKQAQRSGTTRPFWCELLDARRVDPHAEFLEELLSDSDEVMLKWGIVLSKYHEDAQRRAQVAQKYLHDMRRPHLRAPAVELAVFNGDPVAWMLCRQMATVRDYPRAAELLAYLGTLEEVRPLFRRLEEQSGDVIWRACKSGRKIAAVHAAQALKKNRCDELAGVGLSYIIGDHAGSGNGVERLLDRWAEVAPTMDDQHRYLFGERYGNTSIKMCLSQSDERHHRVLGDELYFRSKGKFRWQGLGFAVDMLEQLEKVGTLVLDFDVGVERGRG